MMIAVKVEVIGGGCYEVGLNDCVKIEQIQTGIDSAAYSIIFRDGMIYVNEYCPVVVTYKEDN